MKHYLFTSLLLLATTYTVAQNATFSGNRELRQQEEQQAREQIVQLREGCLWVRLQTRSKEIAYYRKHDNHAAADRIQTDVDRFNQRISDAFRKNFTFCPVYFFADTFSMDIVNKQYGNVIFYNDSLQPDPSIRPEKETFFVCEYGKTRDESADEYYRSDYVVKKGDEGTEHSTRYYGGGNLGVTAFVIMDSTFTQLRDPFPYYVKFSFGKNDKARVNAKVLKLSQKLTMYSGKS